MSINANRQEQHFYLWQYKSRNSIGKDSPSFVTRQELITASHLLGQQEVQRDAELSHKALKFDSSELSNEEIIRVKSIIEN